MDQQNNQNLNNNDYDWKKREAGMLYFYGGYDAKKDYIEKLYKKLPKDVKAIIGNDLNKKGDYFSKSYYQQQVLMQAGYDIVDSDLSEDICYKYPYKYFNLKKFFLTDESGYKSIPKDILNKAKNDSRYSYKYYNLEEHLFHFRYSFECINFLREELNKHRIWTLKDVKVMNTVLF